MRCILDVTESGVEWHGLVQPSITIRSPQLVLDTVRSVNDDAQDEHRERLLYEDRAKSDRQALTATKELREGTQQR